MKDLKISYLQIEKGLKKCWLFADQGNCIVGFGFFR